MKWILDILKGLLPKRRKLPQMPKPPAAKPERWDWYDSDGPKGPGSDRAG